MPTDLKKYRGPGRFKKTETTRVVRAAQAAGLQVERLEVGLDGRISVGRGAGSQSPCRLRFDQHE